MTPPLTPSSNPQPHDRVTNLRDWVDQKEENCLFGLRILGFLLLFRGRPRSPQETLETPGPLSELGQGTETKGSSTTTLTHTLTSWTLNARVEIEEILLETPKIPCSSRVILPRHGLSLPRVSTHSPSPLVRRKSRPESLTLPRVSRPQSGTDGGIE